MTLSVRSSHSSAWAVCARDDFKLLQRKLHTENHHINTIFCRICVGGRVPKQWTALKIQLLLVNFSEWKKKLGSFVTFSLSPPLVVVCVPLFFVCCWWSSPLRAQSHQIKANDDDDDDEGKMEWLNALLLWISLSENRWETGTAAKAKQTVYILHSLTKQ